MFQPFHSPEKEREGSSVRMAMITIVVTSSQITKDAQPEAHGRKHGAFFFFSLRGLGLSADADLGLVRSRSCKQSVAGGELKGHRPPAPRGQLCQALCVWAAALDGPKHKLFSSSLEREKKKNK